jgi:hypothetical protein
MTAPLSAQRVAKLYKRIGLRKAEAMGNGRFNEADMWADVLAILDDYSSLRAENETLKDKLAEVTKLWSTAERDATHLYARMMKAEAQLARQAPLIQAAMETNSAAIDDAAGRYPGMGAILRAALAYREGEK